MATTGEPVPGVALFVALVFTMVAVVVTIVGYLVAIPAAVAWAAVASFAGGVVIAAVLAYRDARATGVSIPRAVGRAIRLGGRWIVEFMP
ncbi:MAG: hypothetical protein EPO13_11345 [Actinomycetota bacterium]|nr:MAG: hypothetical protein EPO13_11345 [Actinomycetota bacterium]